MPIAYLPPEDHVVRYVPWSRLRKDENDNVLGVLGAAFKLRDGEDYLSATWAECCGGSDHQARIEAAVRTVRASNLKVTTRSGFAVGNVGRVKEVCLADKEKHKVRVIHEPEPDNKTHTALRGWPRNNDPLLELIAEDSWSEVVLNQNVPP